MVGRRKDEARRGKLGYGISFIPVLVPPSLLRVSGPVSGPRAQR